MSFRTQVRNPGIHRKVRMTTKIMQDLLEYLVKQLTGEENITVDASKDGETDVYTINAPQAVMGLLIGREGKTIRAIRAVAKARAIIDQVSIAVKLQEV